MLARRVYYSDSLAALLVAAVDFRICQCLPLASRVEGGQGGRTECCAVRQCERDVSCCMEASEASSPGYERGTVVCPMFFCSCFGADLVEDA